MEATAEFRNLLLVGYAGGVFLMSPADIGSQVWLRIPDKDWEGPFLVVDCATRGDIYPIVKYRDEVVEVDWEQAQKWGMVDANDNVLKWRLDDVEVSKLPTYMIEGDPVDYQSWWLENYQPTGSENIGSTPHYRPPSSWFIDGKWVDFRSIDKRNYYSGGPGEKTEK